jgi:hypothetical protein
MKMSYEKKMEMLAEVAAAFDRAVATCDAWLAENAATMAELSTWPVTVKTA